MTFPNPSELTREITALHESACSSAGKKPRRTDNRVIHYGVNGIDKAFRSGKLNSASTQEEAHEHVMKAVPAIIFWFVARQIIESLIWLVVRHVWDRYTNVEPEENLGSTA